MVGQDLQSLRSIFLARARLMCQEATGMWVESGAEGMERIVETGEPTTRLGRYVQASIREEVATATAKAVAAKTAAEAAAEAAVTAAVKAAAETAATASAEATAKAVAESLEAQRALLGRQAVKKFGQPEAARLAEVLAGVSNFEWLSDIGEWLFDCETVDELIDRISGMP